MVDPQGSPEVWKRLRVFLTSFSSDEPLVECAKSTKDEFNRYSVEGLLVLIIFNQVGLFLTLQYSIH